jgi:hypothetical protein
MDAEYRENLEKELRLLHAQINTLEGRSGPVFHADLALAIARERKACILRELGMEIEGDK